MTALVAVLALLVALALLWTGVRGFAWASPLKAVLTTLDLLALTLLVAQLGWTGVILLLAANVVGFVGWGLAGWVYVDSELSAGAALSSVSRAEMGELNDALARDARLRRLGPRRRARLIRLPAERARERDEIEVMGPAVGLLWLIAEPSSPEWLVGRLDTILRLYDEPASRAMDLADTIAAATRTSAATAVEMIEAMAVAGSAAPMAEDSS
jgi:hypothetical protein